MDATELIANQQPHLVMAGGVEATVATEELGALLEALLLVAPEPLPIAELAEAAGVSPDVVEQVLAGMQSNERRGWVVVRHRDTVHLASAPRFAPQVRRLLKLEREAKLSGASLETLALIAYRQPVTRAELEALRGVDCSGVLATLHARGLIEVSGRLQTVGNPNQYMTSVEFLRHFGLASLAELPPLDELARLRCRAFGPGIQPRERNAPPAQADGSRPD